MQTKLGQVLLSIVGFLWAFRLAIDLGWKNSADEARRAAMENGGPSGGYEFGYEYAWPTFIGIGAAAVLFAAMNRLRRETWAKRHPFASVAGLLVVLSTTSQVATVDSAHIEVLSGGGMLLVIVAIAAAVAGWLRRPYST